MSLKDRLVRKLMPHPIKAKGALYSMVFSAEDDISQPSEYLISLALDAIIKAKEITLGDVSARIKSPPYWPDIWPGEHYRLLAGLVSVLKPKLIIEIGTGAGLSALSMMKSLPLEGKIATFDLIDWQNNPSTVLQATDFSTGRLIQYIDDLSDSSAFSKHQRLLENANLIFIDAAKDGKGEQKFLDNFRSVSFKKNPLLVFDDIRLWNMLKIWRNISLPKLDLTSFGHWSGTGIVEWR